MRPNSLSRYSALFACSSNPRFYLAKGPLVVVITLIFIYYCKMAERVCAEINIPVVPSGNSLVSAHFLTWWTTKTA
jgi:hypothetical protein